MCKEEPYQQQIFFTTMHKKRSIALSNLFSLFNLFSRPIKENILRCRYLKIMRAVKTDKQQLSPVCQTFAPVWR